MRDCCHGNCNQGRECPARIERDRPAAAFLAAVVSVVLIAGPFAYMLLGGPHA